MILAVICLLIIICTVIYCKYIRPMRIVKRGMDLVREQDFASRLRRVGQSDADRLVDMFNQMMDCLKHERLRVREQNEFLDLLINESPMGVILLDDSSVIQSSNRAADAIFNCGPMKGLRLSEIDSPLARHAAGLKMRTSVTVNRDNENEIFRLSKLGFMNDGWLHPFILVESLTEEVREAERRAYTRVIRIMAHEVNNSVGGISSTLQSIESEIEGTPAASRLLPPLRACAERADSLIGFIKAYAEVISVPEPQLRLTDYHALVHSSLPLLESICARYGASLSADLDDADPLRCDPVLIRQAMVNVVKNAAESAGKDGKVTITAHGKTLVVSDNGPGISEDASRRLFTDVFTTKPDGHGLGLMLVGEILRKHNWQFSLRTSGPLTNFTLTAS